MKVPKPRKLPSGSYFIQLRINGQSISITEATADLCTAKAMAIKTGLIKAKKSPENITLSKAIDKYIARKDNILSPSTIRGYKTIQRTRFKAYMPQYINSFTQHKCQKMINEEARLCSAKTLKNAWGLISAVLNDELQERFEIALPPVVAHDKPFLTPEQIPIFLKAIENTDIEIPCLLGLWSCRRSEIYGLKWSNIDFEKKLIYIENSKVLNTDNEQVLKNTVKNKSSQRKIPITDRLFYLLQNAERKSDFVVNTHINSLYKSINNICEKNGLPKIGVHGLRHSFASLGYSLQIPEKYLMEIGGWANDATMKKIYTHLAKADTEHYRSMMSDFYNKIH